MGSKNILLILLAAVIIGGAFLLSEYMNGSGATNAAQYGNAGSVVNPVIATSTVEPITYNDDWQKTLFNTASSSSWLDISNSGAAVSSTPESDLSATDILGQDVFAEYISAKQAGEDTSATDTQIAIAGQVLADGTFLSSPKVYDKSDFRITSDNSTAALLAYGNEVATIFQENNPPSPNEIVIVQDALNNDDPDALKKINPILADYTAVLKGLLALKVPSAVADFHKNLLNGMSELVFADNGFTKIYSDSLVSLQAITMYQNSLKDISTALSGLVQYFMLANVTFPPNDPGAALFTIKSQ
jgi:hypothetical protein